MGADRDTGDAALLRAVAQGDDSALAALYDRHAGWLHARLSRRCGDPEAVREVLQDTFVAVWRSAAAHRGTEVGGWLWTIAARRLADALRVQARASRVEPAEVSTAPSAEDDVLAGLQYGDVGTALDRISPELRAVLYFDAAYLSYAAPHLRTATVWTWSRQPGPWRWRRSRWEAAAYTTRGART